VRGRIHQFEELQPPMVRARRRRECRRAGGAPLDLCELRGVVRPDADAIRWQQGIRRTGADGDVARATCCRQDEPADVGRSGRQQNRVARTCAVDGGLEVSAGRDRDRIAGRRRRRRRREELESVHVADDTGGGAVEDEAG
jgi:hypothetical protein